MDGVRQRTTVSWFHRYDYTKIADGTLGYLRLEAVVRKLKNTTHGNPLPQTTCIEHLPDSNFWHYALQLNTYKYPPIGEKLRKKNQKYVFGLLTSHERYLHKI